MFYSCPLVSSAVRQLLRGIASHRVAQVAEFARAKSSSVDGKSALGASLAAVEAHLGGGAGAGYLAGRSQLSLADVVVFGTLYPIFGKVRAVLCCLCAFCGARSVVYHYSPSLAARRAAP